MHPILGMGFENASSLEYRYLWSDKRKFRSRVTHMSLSRDVDYEYQCIERDSKIKYITGSNRRVISRCTVKAQTVFSFNI
jgi:hypothetical protein